MEEREQVQSCLIQDLRPGMRPVSCRMIVLEKGEGTPTKMGKLFPLLVADHTSSISFSVFDDFGEAIKPGDILFLSNGYCILFRGVLTIYVGQKGSIKRLGEITMVFAEFPNMSLFSWRILDPLQPLKYTPFLGSQQDPSKSGVIPNMSGSGFLKYEPPADLSQTQQVQQALHQQAAQQQHQQQQQQQQRKDDSRPSAHKQFNNVTSNSSNRSKSPQHGDRHGQRPPGNRSSGQSQHHQRAPQNSQNSQSRPRS